MQWLWKCKLPLKIKVFLWLACQGRLQTGMALKRKKWKGNEKCVVCNVSETVDHIFFICPLDKFAWECIKEALGWDRAPNSLQDLIFWNIGFLQDVDNMISKLQSWPQSRGRCGMQETRWQLRRCLLDHQLILFFASTSFCRDGRYCCGEMPELNWRHGNSKSGRGWRASWKRSKIVRRIKTSSSFDGLSIFYI